jgi:hypothetical protein
MFASEDWSVMLGLPCAGSANAMPEDAAYASKIGGAPVSGLIVDAKPADFGSAR